MSLSKSSRLHFLGLETPYRQKETALFQVLPVAYEKTTTFGQGTRYGPRATLVASYQVELFDEELKMEPYRAGVYTFPEFSSRKAPQIFTQDLYQYAKNLLQKDKVLVSLGGEHTVSIGLIQAHAEKYPDLGILHFDAHGDLREAYEGSPYNHACVARRWLEFCPRLVQVGIRNLSKEEFDFIREIHLPVFYAREVQEGRFSLSRLLSLLPKTIYITFDVDALDPAVIPATGTPEPGGLGWYSTLDILKYVMARRRVVGFDVVEISTQKGSHVTEFTCAKLVYKMMGYLYQKRFSTL